MYNTKFILEDNNEVYPGYLEKEMRKTIKEKYSDKRGYMWCGCEGSKRLYYRISEDLKIYPEHNDYIHNINCCRYKTVDGQNIRKTAYVVDDESGEVTAYLKFNPKNLTDDTSGEEKETTSDSEIEEEETECEEMVIEKESETKNEELKEPKLSLASLVRSINVDTYTEKVLKDIKITNSENFSKQVYFRMKKIRVSRMKKSIGDLTLENDGVRFVYVPCKGALKTSERGLSKCYFITKGVDGKEYKNFVYPETMEKAIKEFKKKYGIEPNERTMLAAFQYYKKNRSGTKYKVLGRVHLFQTSNLGIYCNNMIEEETYDTLSKITEEDSNIKFWIQADDESNGGIIKIKNKQKRLLLLFRTNKNECITYNEDLYEPIVIGKEDPLTVETFYEIVDQMC